MSSITVLLVINHHYYDLTIFPIENIYGSGNESAVERYTSFLK